MTATNLPVGPPADGPEDTGPISGGATKPPPATEGSGDQPWSWHAGRAAALLLVVLVPLHFAVTFVVDDVGATTARSMSERLDDPTWRVLTWLVIALALVHATLSARTSARAGRSGRTATVVTVVTVAVGVAAVLLLLAATSVLVGR